MAALIVGVVLIAFVLLGSGGSGHTYHLLFENGGQLVPGNQVLVAGQPVGTVNDITLTDNALADVKITTDNPLREGTTAIIRATSLSGVANRYVSLSMGPSNSPEIDDGATLDGSKTTSPVDLDQLFDTFTPQTRAALQKVIQGSATIYAGNTKAANKTYKYFAPALDSTQRLLDELTRDQSRFTDFLVSSSRVLTAIAARHDQLTALVSNSNQALGAIASQNDALDRSLVALPPAMRQANTTFVNLRSTLDDLDPLVQATKPATKDLPLFLRNLRPVAEQSVPVLGNLATALRLPGKRNDLVDVLRELPGLATRSHPASEHAINAFDASQPEVTVTRPYTPELTAFIAGYGQAAAPYDANGHYVRVEPAVTGFFDYNTVTHQLDPMSLADQYNGPDNTPNGLQTGLFTRCPGGSTQPIPGSNPFLDDGNLTGKCSPGDVPPGP